MKREKKLVYLIIQVTKRWFKSFKIEAKIQRHPKYTNTSEKYKKTKRFAKSKNQKNDNSQYSYKIYWISKISNSIGLCHENQMLPSTECTNARSPINRYSTEYWTIHGTYMSDIKIVQRLASVCSCAIVEKKSRLNKNGKWFRKLSFNSIQLTIQLYFIAEHRWDWMHENQSKDVLHSHVIENVNCKDMNRI